MLPKSLKEITKLKNEINYYKWKTRQFRKKVKEREKELRKLKKILE